MASERFPKSHRITQRADFLRCYEAGRNRHGRYVVVFALVRAGENPIADAPPARLGITATRKIGKSHVRNLLRRRVREWFRRQSGSVSTGADIVVNLKRSAIDASFAVLSQDLAQVFRRLDLIQDEPPKERT